MSSPVLIANNKRPASGSPAVRYSPPASSYTVFSMARSPQTGGRLEQPAGIYNAGNDDIENINRFSFPAISFSPSFPRLSPSEADIKRGGAYSSNTLSPIFSHGMLSPLSPGTGVCDASSLLPRTPSGILSPSTGSGSHRSSTGPESPLPPLSPRGLKLADAERFHKVKCFNRIVEKRRKASDGMRDVVIIETVPYAEAELAPSNAAAPTFVSPFQHARKVSFKLSVHDPLHALAISLPSSLHSGTGATISSNSPAASLGSLGAASVPGAHFGFPASVSPLSPLGARPGRGCSPASPFDHKLSMPSSPFSNTLDSAPASPLVH